MSTLLSGLLLRKTSSLRYVTCVCSVMVSCYRRHVCCSKYCVYPSKWSTNREDINCTRYCVCPLQWSTVREDIFPAVSTVLSGPLLEETCLLLYHVFLQVCSRGDVFPASSVLPTLFSLSQCMSVVSGALCEPPFDNSLQHSCIKGGCVHK